MWIVDIPYHMPFVTIDGKTKSQVTHNNLNSEPFFPSLTFLIGAFKTYVQHSEQL